jgi:polyisoprenoid-binding protein YceI
VTGLDGIELPPAGTYVFDQVHSAVDFLGTHMFTKTRGRFTAFSGTVVVGGTPEESSVEVTIEAASLRTSLKQRDDHLRSPDFLSVEVFPSIAFRSTAVRHTGGRSFELDGDLTIRDITNPVTLVGKYLGTGTDPSGRISAGFSASTRFEREDWDMTWNAAVETGGFLVGKTVTVEVEVAALRRD